MVLLNTLVLPSIAYSKCDHTELAMLSWKHKAYFFHAFKTDALKLPKYANIGRPCHVFLSIITITKLNFHLHLLNVCSPTKQKKSNNESIASLNYWAMLQRAPVIAGKQVLVS